MRLIQISIFVYRTKTEFHKNNNGTIDPLMSEKLNFQTFSSLMKNKKEKGKLSIEQGRMALKEAE